jgi:poly(beta-D-mannuronate) lyase
MSLKKITALSALAISISAAQAATFVMEKVDTGYVIDGNWYSTQEGEQVYLWEKDDDYDNENQHWVQLDRGDGYYSYKKYDTNLCLDGGDGGSNYQAVTLEECDEDNYDQHWEKIKVTSGTEIYRFAKRNDTDYSIDGSGSPSNGQVIYLYKSDSDNENQQWELTNLADVDSDDSSDSTTSTDYDLDKDSAPSDNFDLTDWYLSVPTDTDDNGYSDDVKEEELNDSYESDYFYTGDDGAMVFECTVGGYKTSSSTDYTRVELREMLRRGDTSIDSDDKANNWAFSSIDSDDQSDFGGIDGVMEATLAVNAVTTTSSNEEQVGRIIIGQIHAEDNEPIRLYYHKQPDATRGAIYFAHEPSKSAKEDGQEELWFNLLGNFIDDDNDEGGTSYNDDLSDMDPSDGIELDEVFSYRIEVDGDWLMVTISDEDGNQLAYKEVDMADSGYDDSDNYMFFKAGIYLNDKTSDDDDSAKVSFYKLENDHENYDDDSDLL